MIKRTLPASRTTFLALLVATAATSVACSSAPEEQRSAWSCQSVEVPMGESVRCTQSAATADGPAVLDRDTAITTPTSVYECNEGDPECPSADATQTTSSSGGDGEPCTGENDDPDLCGGGTGAGGGARECGYVPDLPYCSGGDATDGSAGSGEGTPCEGPSCGAPGQDKKNGGANGGGSNGNDGANGNGGSNGNGNGNGGNAGGGTTDGTAGGGGKSGGKGRHYTCTKDDDGNRECESTPDCAPGTHPSACGACVTDGDTADCVPPSAGGCWVTGGGFIEGPNVTTGAAPDGHDNFGGNAKPMKDGRIQGNWNHVDHGTGNHAKGKPAYIVCRHVDEPGPGQPGGKKGFTMNQIYFGGPAEWSEGGGPASAGYWFDVVAKDHGEPGSQRKPKKNGGMVDTYHFTIRKMDDPAKQVSGAIVYETKENLSGGNIQLHPPNAGHPYTPMTLPSWVSYEP